MPECSLAQVKGLSEQMQSVLLQPEGWQAELSVRALRAIGQVTRPSWQMPSVPVALQDRAEVWLMTHVLLSSRNLCLSIVVSMYSVVL